MSRTIRLARIIDTFCIVSDNTIVQERLLVLTLYPAIFLQVYVATMCKGRTHSLVVLFCSCFLGFVGARLAGLELTILALENSAVLSSTSKQTHFISVDSDFRRLNEWWQYPGIAMA